MYRARYMRYPLRMLPRRPPAGGAGLSADSPGRREPPNPITSKATPAATACAGDPGERPSPLRHLIFPVGLGRRPESGRGHLVFRDAGEYD